MSDPSPRISVDTNVVSAIVRENAYSVGYLEVLDLFTPALTFFVRGELAAAQWNRQRRGRIANLLSRWEYLPDPSNTTLEAYARVTIASSSLGLGDALGSDLWILAQTYAAGIPFVSHDSNAIRTADRAGIEFHTLNRRALRLVDEDRAQGANL